MMLQSWIKISILPTAEYAASEHSGVEHLGSVRVDKVTCSMRTSQEGSSVAKYKSRCRVVEICLGTFDLLEGSALFRVALGLELHEEGYKGAVLFDQSLRPSNMLD